MAPTDTAVIPATVAAALLKDEPTDRTTRAGLCISIPRTDKVMKKGHYAQSYSSDSIVMVAAAAETMLHEVTGRAMVVAIDHKKKRVIPDHVKEALEKNTNLRQAFPGVVIVMDEPRKAKRVKKAEEEASSSSSEDDEEEE